jgi:hypothetical protein
LKWATDTPNTVGVIGNKSRAIVTAGSGFGEANIVAYYKSRGLCAEDITTFEVLPKKVDGRMGKLSEQYDFLQNKCTLGLQDSSVDHPIDGCSGPGIQDIKSKILQLTPGLGTFTLYQKDGEHDFPVWGEYLGDIPDSSIVAKSQTLACNVHDICYQTCGSDRGSCDTALGADARKECDNHYPAICPSSFSLLTCIQFQKERKACKIAVTIMYDGVVGAAGFGSKPYYERQSQHCLCCKP